MSTSTLASKFKWVLERFKSVNADARCEHGLGHIYSHASSNKSIDKSGRSIDRPTLRMWNEYVSVETTDEPDDLSRVDNGVSNIHKMVFLDVIASLSCIYPTPFDTHHIPVPTLSRPSDSRELCSNIYRPQTKFGAR